MGLLKFINKTLPPAWDKAAREMKVKGALCESIYSALPKYFKGNKLRDREVMNRATNAILTKYKRDVIYAVDVNYFPYRILERLSQRIKQIEEECK